MVFGELEVCFQLIGLSVTFWFVFSFCKTFSVFRQLSSSITTIMQRLGDHCDQYCLQSLSGHPVAKQHQTANMPTPPITHLSYTSHSQAHKLLFTQLQRKTSSEQKAKKKKNTTLMTASCHSLSFWLVQWRPTNPLFCFSFIHFITHSISLPFFFPLFAT